MLGDKKLFLLDIDGTICKGNQLIGGTKEFLSDIEKNGGKNRSRILFYIFFGCKV